MNHRLFAVHYHNHHHYNYNYNYYFQLLLNWPIISEISIQAWSLTGLPTKNLWDFHCSTLLQPDAVPVTQP